MNGGINTDGELLKLCRSVAHQARAGEQIEAYAVRTDETDIDVVGGRVESLTIAGTSGIGVRVIHDHRQGFAWCGSLDADLVAETLQEARDNATFAEPDEWNGLLDPASANGAAVPELDLWRESLREVSVDAKVDYALELDRRVRGADSRIRAVESTSYGDGLVESALASSVGIEAAQRRTIVSAASSAVADDGDGAQTGYGFSVGRAFDDLDADEIVRMAVERSIRLLGARSTRSRRIAVVLDPMVTASMLGVLSAAFNGESMLKGRSLFKDRLGELVANPMVDISDDPTDPRSFGAATHDAEGVTCRRNELVRAGVLQRFLHNSYSARRAGNGAATTASAVRGGYRSTPGVGTRALRLSPGTASPDEIVAGLTDAIYVQAVHGLHSGTNPISGDFSVGAEGLMIRDGAYAEPVREVTVASTLGRMLDAITTIGADQTYLPGGACGLTLHVAEMSLSGQ